MSEFGKQTLGFIFDLDGTILDDVDLPGYITKKLAETYGIVENVKEKKDEADKIILKMMSGQASKSLVIRIILKIAKLYGIPLFQRIMFLKKTSEIYREKIKNIPIFDGVPETLDKLKDMGYKIGLNTTSSKNELLQRFEGRLDFLNRFGGFEHGDIITRSDIKRLKPSPEGILIQSQKWNIKPSNLIMIGDMPGDIEAGQNAGTVTIGVLTGFADRKMFEKIGTDFIVNNLKEILDLIDKIKGLMNS